MGWGHCGEDSNGRPIGYDFEAHCDHPGCIEVIDRGLSYVCGDMHGEDEYSCERYFCEEHKRYFIKKDDNSYTTICEGCVKTLLESGEWVEDNMEGVIVRAK